MEYLKGFKMANVRGLTSLQARQLGYAVWLKQFQLLEKGVVHGDLNEYNAIIRVKPEFAGVLQEEAEQLAEPEPQVEDIEAEPLQLEPSTLLEELEEAEEQEPEATSTGPKVFQKHLQKLD